MNTEALNKALLTLVEKKNELATMDYADERYDDVEEELHDLEDDFVEAYGEELEDVLADVHDEYCPDTDVLLPIAYVAQRYAEKEHNGDKIMVPVEGGVPVEMEEYPAANVKLAFAPQPARLVMIVKDAVLHDVWVAK